MGGSSILVVDDSPTVLAFARRTLQQAGYRVVALSNPFAVAASIVREKPALILMDLFMPSLGGEQSVDFLTRNGLLGSARVALFSDRPQEELEAAAKRCGAIGFLRKNGNPSLLVDRVRGWLAADAAL